jgi:hypothetical protein
MLKDGSIDASLARLSKKNWMMKDKEKLMLLITCKTQV